MGNNPACCNYNKGEIMEPYSKKLFKIYPERENKNVIKYVICYDIEMNVTDKKFIPNVVNSIKGYGEIIYSNNLYFCGGDDSYIGSNYFFKFTIENGVVPLVNCIYSHKYPTLIGVLKSIYCIGGIEDNVYCERYIIRENRWEKVSPLPTSRYGCTGYFDYNTKHLYLFGGFNYISNQMIENVIQLKISSKNNHNWEELNFTRGDLLKKTLMGIIPLDSNNILLVGGLEFNEKKCSDVETNKVIKVDLSEKSVNEEIYKLSRAGCFNNKACVDFGHGSFNYLIDDNFYVHRFYTEEQKFDSIKILNC